MLLRICTITLLLVYHLHACAQDIELQRLLLAKDDTNKVKSLMKYGAPLKDVDNARAETVYRHVLTLSDKLKYDFGKAEALVSLAYIQAHNGNYLPAIQGFKTAVYYLKKIHLFDKAILVQNSVGTLYDFLGKRDSAIITYMRSVQELEKENDPRNMIALGDTYCSLGVLHGNNNENEKSFYYLKKSVSILKNTKDTVSLIEALTELSDRYSETGQYTEGFPFARKALSLALSANRNNVLGSNVSTAYYSIASVHLGLHQTDSAITEAKLCMSIALAAGDDNEYTGGAMILADCYKALNRQEDRYRTLHQALDICIRSSNVLLMYKLYEPLSDAAARTGRYAEALSDYKHLTAYKDSIFNQKNQSTISELEVKYQTAQKEKLVSSQQLQITTKDLQLQKSRLYIYCSLGALLVAALVCGLLYLQYRNRKAGYARQLQHMQQEKDIQLLHALMLGEEKERSRIAKDLHDGVAGLLAAAKMHLYTMASQHAAVLPSEGYRRGVQLIDEAATEVRKTSHNLMPEVLLQNGLDEALRRYCRNISNSHTLRVQYDAIGNIGRYKNSFELSVYRIVQELLNNVIKHSKATEALVQISCYEQILSITIEDNGVGFSKNNPSANDGMGLRSLQSRVEAMNGKLHVDADAGSGVSAYIEFEVAGVNDEYRQV